MARQTKAWSPPLPEVVWLKQKYSFRPQDSLERCHRNSNGNNMEEALQEMRGCIKSQSFYSYQIYVEITKLLPRKTENSIINHRNTARGRLHTKGNSALESYISSLIPKPAGGINQELKASQDLKAVLIPQIPPCRGGVTGTLDEEINHQVIFKQALDEAVMNLALNGGDDELDLSNGKDHSLADNEFYNPKGGGFDAEVNDTGNQSGDWGIDGVFDGDEGLNL